MANLIKVEIKKILYSKVFYIMLVLFFVLYLMHFENPDKFFSYYVRYEKNFSATAVGHTIFFTRNSINIVILSVYSSIYAVSDFKTGIINNLLAKGYSRNKIFLSKLFTLIITVICVLIYVESLYFFTGLMRYGVVDYPELFWGKECLLGIMLCNLSYSVIVFCISYLIRNAYLSVIYGTLSFSIIETILFEIITNLFKGRLFYVEVTNYGRTFIKDVFLHNFLFSGIFKYFGELNQTYNNIKDFAELKIMIPFFVALIIYPVVTTLITMIINKRKN